MVSEAIKSLKRSYKNQDGVKIGRDLIQPCLKECVKYRRGTGTFSSSAFKAYIGAIDHFLNDDIKIEILCSPKIDINLLRVLERCTASYDRDKILQKTTNELLLAAAGCKADPERTDYRSTLLAYLIANDKLEIKIALPLNNSAIQTFDSSEDDELDMDNINTRAMYHIKYGYFLFPDKSIVAFEGSVNETDTALNFNTEKATVYRSWISGDDERLQDVIEDLDKDWKGDNNDIRIYSIDTESLKIIREHAPSKRPHMPNRNAPPIAAPQPAIVIPVISNADKIKWRHQDEALKIFLNEKSGILEMATGSGKTKTALKIVSHLFESNEINQVIISMYGNDLLNQWFNEIFDSELYEKKYITKVFRCFGEQSQASQFKTNPDKSLIIVSVDKLDDILKNFDPAIASKTMIIHDEIHDLGAPSRRLKLQGLYKNFIYKLGLSATPDREYDQDGNVFIETEIGKVIFSFSIEDAIKRGVLVEFNYSPLSYVLSEEDKKRLTNVWAKKSNRAKEGRPMSSEEIARDLSDVYKTAEYKPLEFKKYLQNHSDCLKNCIIFVANKSYGEQILEIIHQYTNSYKTYYDTDGTEYLEQFSRGEIDTLITCHKISQGIDIRELNTVVLMASDRAKLETIQRIGRCLRSDTNNPNKKAHVIDFCLADAKEDSADEERKNWLTQLSNIKKEIVDE